MRRALWGSLGSWAFSYRRGTPVSQVGTPKYLLQDVSLCKITEKYPGELAVHLRDRDPVRSKILDDSNSKRGGDAGDNTKGGGVVPQLRGYRKRLMAAQRSLPDAEPPSTRLVHTLSPSLSHTLAHTPTHTPSLSHTMNRSKCCGVRLSRALSHLSGRFVGSRWVVGGGRFLMSEVPL